MIMDSVMLGSLTFYRKLLGETLFSPDRMSASPSSFARRDLPLDPEQAHQLPTFGHQLSI
jgi:solute carrier family 25 carnitine/acylcarnitine transporter 20/29